jgi:hypothetical protein
MSLLEFLGNIGIRESTTYNQREMTSSNISIIYDNTGGEYVSNEIKDN